MSASKDVEMIDTSSKPAVEVKKGPEPVDPFFGILQRSLLISFRIQEDNGFDGESSKRQRFQADCHINQIIKKA